MKLLLPIIFVLPCQREQLDSIYRYRYATDYHIYIYKYKILHILVKKVIYYSNIYKRWKSLCFKLEKRDFSLECTSVGIMNSVHPLLCNKRVYRFHVETSFAHHVVVAPPPQGVAASQMCRQRGRASAIVASHNRAQYKDVTFSRFFQMFCIKDILLSVLHLECLIFMLFL